MFQARRPRALALFLGTAISLIAVAAAAVQPSHAAQGATAKIRVAVGTTVPDPIAAEIWVAAEKGYYAKEGVDPDITAVPGALTAISILQAGQTDATVSTPDALPAANLQGANLLSVHQLWYSPIFSFAFFNQSGSNCKSIQTLKGCRIGVANLGSAAIPMLYSVLDQQGLKRSDVTLVPIGAPPAQALSAIQSGRIDMTLISTINLAFLKYNGVKFTQAPLGSLAQKFPGFSVNTNRSTLENASKKSALVHFLRAIVRAQQYCIDAPRGCAAAYAKNVKDPTSVDLLTAMIKARRAPMALPKAAAGRFGWSTPSYWATMIKAQVDAGVISKSVAPTSVFTTFLMQKVNAGIVKPQPKK